MSGHEKTAAETESHADLDAAARKWLGMCTWPLTAKDREIIDHLLSKVGGSQIKAKSRNHKAA